MRVLGMMLGLVLALSWCVSIQTTCENGREKREERASKRQGGRGAGGKRHGEGESHSRESESWVAQPRLACVDAASSAWLCLSRSCSDPVCAHHSLAALRPWRRTRVLTRTRAARS